MREATAIKRLQRLSHLIGKYAHTWSESSARLYGWVVEYNSLKEQYPTAFQEYCTRSGLALEHDGYDCLC